MKFKFCSDGDCPLWALAGLHALSSLPSPLFRNLLHHIVDEQPDDGIMDILKDTNLSSREECARAAAVLRWTLRQAHRCACTGVQLARDLLVLGVPRAHAASLAEAADNTRDAYEANIKSNGFIINKMTGVSTQPGPEGTVDTVQLTLMSEEVFSGNHITTELLIDKTLVKDLLHELKTAYNKMNDIDFE
ncbi:COMM domain-containing protein 4 isoform X1 [Pieris rapae]|uniref:COMM domain-containing protein 4 isoform X1 n=1 Tax=Pieris rapae TaxID=64459 RepID=UPI001E27D20E|nr:COMM domain-containing protein 4 isoform X1 [Pieris rapae]